MERHKLRLHNLVASLSAELDRLCVLICAVASEGARTHEGETERQHHQREVALSWFVEIDFGIGEYCRSRRTPPSSSLDQHPGHNHEQTKHEERGQDDVRDDTEVWITARLGQL